MVIPNWLASATGANAFASNPANGYQPTIGDALQGIGHSMMEHYRAGPSATSAGQPAAQPGAAPTVNPLAAPVVIPPTPQVKPVVFSQQLPPTLGQIANLWK